MPRFFGLQRVSQKKLGRIPDLGVLLGRNLGGIPDLGVFLRRNSAEFSIWACFSEETQGNRIKQNHASERSLYPYGDLPDWWF